MKHIFMVEDNEDHALLIRKAIEGQDCVISHFQDGLDFLKEIRQMEPRGTRPDLVFLDLKLPGMDGFEILKQFRQIRTMEQVPVVILTTSKRREEIERAYQLGAAGFLTKSEQFGELTAKLKRVKDYWFSTVEVPCGDPLIKAVGK